LSRRIFFRKPVSAFAKDAPGIEGHDLEAHGLAEDPSGWRVFGDPARQL
jgi:hypothetical protein